MERKTPLYALHESLGGRIVPFAGYLLPVQYPSGVIHEHMAVRERAGVFDVSHMGEVLFEGPEALGALNRLMANDLSGMYDGQVRYSPMLNERAASSTTSSSAVLRERYMAVVNAANRERTSHGCARTSRKCQMTDVSDDWRRSRCRGAVEGHLLTLTDEALIPKKYYSFTPGAEVAGIASSSRAPAYRRTRLRTVYEARRCGSYVRALREAGAGRAASARATRSGSGGHAALRPRDDRRHLALEAGLAWAVKPEHAFIGRSRCFGADAARVGLRSPARASRARAGLFLADEKIGAVTSGTHLPYLGGAYAMALVSSEHAQIGTVLDVDVRGRRVSAEIVPLPFYKRQK